jgi:hypothetical protein
MAPRNHDTGPSGVTVDELVDQIFPVIDDLLGQIQGDEFTTTDFIELMQSVPGTAEAYSQVIVAWGEQERQSKMVIHGQVIPAALRRSTRVEWAGFAHGIEDEYAVPAWWKLVTGA